TVTNHDRDSAGMRYIYPVASRRAGGLSIGVNLNPNNACNWCCCYCQVPNLVRGSAPEIDTALLKMEFVDLLHRVVDGNFLQQQLPEGMRQLCDVAISGNGEPTSSRQFADVVDMLADSMAHAGIGRSVPLRVITNGSYCGRAVVQQGLRRMAQRGGEIWIKVDGGDVATVSRINGVSVAEEQICKQVEQAASCCPTWVQSCMIACSDGRSVLSDGDVDRYLHLLVQLRPSIEGVYLYTPVRPSHQQDVGVLPQEWMDALAGKIETLGLRVHLA
ncbi:MAG: radical SAM protein, partial [Mariprofundales bacterium]|nr:radical SAM protein [Mariprofundales bacterium]